MDKQPELEPSVPANAGSPFVTIEASCPVCGRVATQRKTKSHLFLEQNLDIDLRPRKIVRKKAGLERYNPLMYFIWLCPNCLYAAGRPYYEDPGQGTGLGKDDIVNGLKAKLESVPALSKLVAILTKDADPEIRDRFHALKLTLAAIVQLQSAVETPVQATPALARYYLRVAWLYNEMEDKTRSLENILEKSNTLTVQLKKAWSTIPVNEEAALKLSGGLYELSLAESRVLDDELDSVRVYLLAARIQAKLGAVAKARNLWNKGRNVARQFEAKRSKENPHSQDMLIKSENMKTAVKEVADLLTGLSMVSDPALDADLKARDIIDGYFGTDMKELRRLLAQRGIDQEVIDRLVPQKRGGLLGLFKK